MDFIKQEFSSKELEQLKDVYDNAIGGAGLGKYTWEEDGSKRELKNNPYERIKNAFFSYQDNQTITAPKQVWLDFLGKRGLVRYKRKTRGIILVCLEKIGKEGLVKLPLN